MDDREYKLTVGLEVHAELKTQTKMFCACKNDPDEKRPNVNICPICMAHPGTLPVINRLAVHHVLRVGAAIKGTLADFTEFDRKNYFYPDIPKGYQISQYAYPLVKGGTLNGVAITRVHLEEDTARSSHKDDSYSLVDFNRAGVPLMELVTEPVIRSSREAAAFAEELQLLLRTLGVGEANMEKGEMRVEANISVSNTDTFGTKVEVKNLNSFRSVEHAIQYEMKRQIEVLRRGGSLVQETRGYDEVKDITFSQRLKESSHDYRYFPDPDLPKLRISEIPEFKEEKLMSSLGELPDEKRARYTSYGIKPEDVEMIIRDHSLEQYIDAVFKNLESDEEKITATNYITSDLAGYKKTLGQHVYESITPTHLADLARFVLSKKLSSRGVKMVIEHLLSNKDRTKTAESVAVELDLFQKSDDATVQDIVSKLISENASVVAEYQKGKTTSLQYLIGQGMKISKGSINPELLKTALIKHLSQG